MFAWWVLLILCLTNVVLLLGTLRFIYYYMHADDYRYNQGIFAQVVSVIGLQLIWISLSIPSVDAYNTAFDGSFNMLYFWQLTYLTMSVYLSTILPLAVFYYEADSDPRITKTRPSVQALKRGAISIGVTWTVVALFYLLCFKITLPQLDCIAFDPPDDPVAGKCLQYSAEVRMVSGTLHFLNYLVALPGFLGWFPFTFQAGVGLAAIPIVLIQHFRNRPEPLSTQQYQNHKKTLGERASTLRKIGEGLKNQEQSVAKKTGVSKTSAKMKLKRTIGKYQQVVELLEHEYDLMETAYHKRGENPIVSWLKLIGGLVAVLFTVFIVWEIIAVILGPQVFKKSKSSLTLLSNALVAIRRGKAFAPDWALFVACATYMVAAALAGGIKIHRRMKGFLPVDPLKPKDTHLNAILFHTAVLMLGACSVIQLFTQLVPGYLEGTEAEALFSAQRFHMNVLSPMYKNNTFVWVMLVVAAISAAWLIIFPKDQPALDLDDPKVIAQWAKVQKQLGVDEDDPGAVRAPDPEDLQAAENSAPGGGLMAKAKGKLDRIDQNINNAPGNLLGATVRHPFKF